MKSRLSTVFASIFVVVLVLNLVSCLLGFFITSFIDDLTLSFHIALTSGKPRWPYMLYSEAISATFNGIAAGIIFWAGSFALAYLFEVKITKSVRWLITAIASFCFGLWYYFLIPDVITIFQNDQHFMLFIAHSSISGFIMGITQWLYIRKNIPKSSLWIVSTIVCYLLFGTLVFWISPED